MSTSLVSNTFDNYFNLEIAKFLHNKITLLDCLISLYCYCTWLVEIKYLNIINYAVLNIKISTQNLHYMQAKPTLITLAECFILSRVISKAIKAEIIHLMSEKIQKQILRQTSCGLMSAVFDIINMNEKQIKFNDSFLSSEKGIVS